MIDLAAEIAKELAEYSEEVDKAMQKSIDTTAKLVRNSLKENPNIPTKSGDYKKEFFVKKLAQGKGYKRVVVANKHYRLTHLLEFGHALRNGKRSKAFPHWDKAQEQADKLSDEIIKELSK